MAQDQTGASIRRSAHTQSGRQRPDTSDLPDFLTRYFVPHPQRKFVNPAALIAIKVAHTTVWAFFVACIVAIPWTAWRGQHRAAAWLAAIVAIEVAVLAFNGWRCPMTSVAARYTDERRENFDIYLPVWLAKAA